MIKKFALIAGLALALAACAPQAPQAAPASGATSSPLATPEMTSVPPTGGTGTGMPVATSSDMTTMPSTGGAGTGTPSATAGATISDTTAMPPASMTSMPTTGASTPEAGATSAPTTGGAGAAIPPAVAEAQRWLSTQFGVSIDQVQVLSSEQVQWPTACLGVETVGSSCAKVVTPGWNVKLSLNGQPYQVHTNADGTVVVMVR